MALNFPSSPVFNQPYFDGTKYWTWTGYAWKIDNFVKDQSPNIVAIDGQGSSGTDTLFRVTQSLTEEIEDNIGAEGYVLQVFPESFGSPSLQNPSANFGII
jgi:hypothetical protein